MRWDRLVRKLAQAVPGILPNVGAVEEVRPLGSNKIQLADAQRRSACRKPRVDQQSIEIVGRLKKSARAAFLAKAVVTSLVREREAGRSFALLKPEIIGFKIEKKDADEVKAEKELFDSIRSQEDLFAKQVTNNYNPCPYNFKYRYRTDDGIREGTCQDWEIEAIYHNWSREYGSSGRSLTWGACSGRNILQRGCFWPWARTRCTRTRGSSMAWYGKTTSISRHCSESAFTLLGQRFLGSNHIRRPRQACRTKCG